MELAQNNPDLDGLPAVFEKYADDVAAVYLFGSVAGGADPRRTDIDLAVVPRGPGAREKQLDMLTDLARAGYCRVDLVFLDTNDLVLKFEAVRRNHPVYLADDFDHGSLFSKVLRQYFDFLPYLKIQQEAWKKRRRHGQS